jgi:transposase InsO family protein
MGKVEKKRTPKYPRELTRKLGLWLVETGKRFPHQPLANHLGVDERTLRNWKGGVNKAPKPLGRPATPPTKRFQARLKVARELHRQGWPGWRSVEESLGPVVSTRLVQESVRVLKHRRSLRKRQWMEARRVHVEAMSPNVLWVQDATHLGRIGRKAVLAEVIKDRATLGYMGITVGEVAKAAEVLRMLEMSKASVGLPLVWATDNGSAYRDKRVKEYLRQEKVVHLLSRPRLPQDNGAAEKGIRELKEEAGLGKGIWLSSFEQAAQKLARSWKVLDSARLRASKGYRTADQLKEALPCWEEKVSREAFYAQACEAQEKGVKGGGTKKQKRQAERQAVYQTLEYFQLVKRTRGGKPLKLATAEPEDIL